MLNNVCTRPRRGEPKELKCPSCDKQFKSVTAMDYHVKRKVCEQSNPRRRSSKSSGPPFACDWCGTLFNMKQTCYVHMARKACMKFPDKYGLKTKVPSLLESLELTLTEGSSGPLKQEPEGTSFVFDNSDGCADTEKECGMVSAEGDSDVAE
ncbi:uncharacterized protein [Euwallacea fornicatus]|uniref:uncharacterized protein n=1 Tax=Euwallacea fornicatus TaxID=995702 RepID=UPI00338FA3E1